MWTTRSIGSSTMKARLGQLGYSVETAHSGPIALKKFKETLIDLAIVDYYMPGMNGDVVCDGNEAAATVRSHHHFFWDLNPP